MEIVPVAIANIGWRVYLIFACFNLAFIPFIYFFVPEVSLVPIQSMKKFMDSPPSIKTAGLSLESVDLCFMDQTQSPVKKANEMRRNIKQGQNATLSHGLDEEKNVENVQGASDGTI